MNTLICNQKKIPKNQWRYGLRSSAATGCGWIAAYNALCLMGYHVAPEKLIRCFERQLPVIQGNLGTMLWSPALCFRHWGFPVGITAKRCRFDEKAKAAKVSILFYRWHKGAKFGAHFVALQYTDQGFVGYNTYANSAGPDCYGDSLDQFLMRKKYFGAVLTTINDKR